MGAEVIKIETAEGETMRTRPPLRNVARTAFGQLNVGKKSLVLDLKSPEESKWSAGWSQPRISWWRIFVPA